MCNYGFTVYELVRHVLTVSCKYLVLLFTTITNSKQTKHTYYSFPSLFAESRTWHGDSDHSPHHRLSLSEKLTFVIAQALNDRVIDASPAPHIDLPNTIWVAILPLCICRTLPGVGRER